MSHAQEVALAYMLGKQRAAKASLIGLPSREIAGLLLGYAVKGVMIWSRFGSSGHVCKKLSEI